MAGQCLALATAIVSHSTHPGLMAFDDIKHHRHPEKPISGSWQVGPEQEKSNQGTKRQGAFRSSCPELGIQTQHMRSLPS